MATVIAITNQKGGVGKTTACIEIATSMHTLGKKVLLIDLDQSCNLSKYVSAETGKAGIYDVLKAEVPISEAIQTLENYSILPATPELSKAEKTFTEITDIYLLQDAIDILNENYDFDYILVDTGPSRSILLNMAYIAAEYFIVPTVSDDGSLSAITELYKDMKKLSKIKAGEKKNSEVLAFILNQDCNYTVHRLARETLQKRAAALDPHPIIASIHNSDADAIGSKILQTDMLSYNKKSKPGKDFYDLTVAILDRLEKKHA